jgi:2-polyprenyl-6-methoxyphenol hydroxylase-like FAD-dependent oxidoreductase
MFKQNSRCLTAVSQQIRYYHYDIIIGGGGLVGVSLATSLAKSKILREKHILLLESTEKYKPTSRENFSNRVSAINKKSIRLIDSLDAWKDIESIRSIKNVMQMQVILCHIHQCFLFLIP